MKKIFFVLLSLIAVMFAASCSNEETYADQKKEERTAIKRFINDSAINVISETVFANQGNTTDVSKNQYVLFDGSGVYMQIVREGCGKVLANGETATILCRFTEYNVKGDSMQLRNDILTYAPIPEKMNVTNNSGTFTASFNSSSSLMYYAYGSTSVPSGWLVPLTYIKIGRPSTATEEIAKVKLIVPHDEGQAYASQYVYPCYYEITYERGR